MIKSLFIFTILAVGIITQAQDIEAYQQNQTLTYEETVSHYSKLDSLYPTCRFFEYGLSDAGKPIYLFVISADRDFSPSSIERKGKAVLLINNGIHPGEPCGVDASANLAQDLLDGTLELPDNLVIGIIPLYNVGGALNRGCCSRANQNGPEEYGFRGNARNLDLNRDFIKTDSRNAEVFSEIFQDWKPHLFIDTHTSNGADYQHVMTLIASQHNKLHPDLATYMNDNLLPHLYSEMDSVNYPMVPYVHTMNQLPENGIMDYLETPRYSTGYATLFNTIGLVSEAHMLKTYEERVIATYELLRILVEFGNTNGSQLVELKNQVNDQVTKQEHFDLQWELDTTRFDLIPFMGYEAKYTKSEVSGTDRLWYDESSPWEADIPYYRYYNPTVNVTAPEYYVVSQAWREVIDRLKLNEIQMEQLAKDTLLTVSTYTIINQETGTGPYEGHYLHTNVQVYKETQTVQYMQGDYIIPVNQEANRYIVETLEPQATDAFFAWNFFDEILQQKEWFSAYVFEELAEEVLAENDQLRQELDSLVANDKDFANNGWGQLYFVYQHSPYYEASHDRYPVARIEDAIRLPLKD